MLCLLGLGILGDTQREDRNKFEIFQSFSFVSGDYNDTSIRVIVNEIDYDIESMFEEVKVFHNKLNGEPDELEISLYNSKDSHNSR